MRLDASEESIRAVNLDTRSEGRISTEVNNNKTDTTKCENHQRMTGKRKKVNLDSSGELESTANRENKLSKSDSVTGVNMEKLEKMIEALIAKVDESKEENRKLREELRERDERWGVERREMSNRILKLEQKIKQQERLMRKNNIVIRGVKFNENLNVEEQVENFLLKELNIKVRVNEVYSRETKNKDKVNVVKMSKLIDKINVMRNKNKLKGQQVYIEDQLTEKESEIQFQIRKRAREEQATGKRVKVGYMKLCINGVWFRWDEVDQQLIEVPKN